MRLSDQVRRAVEESEMSRYRISKKTGIDQSNLSRFVHGEVGLSMEALDRLADVLGLNITVGRTRRGK